MLNRLLILRDFFSDMMKKIGVLLAISVLVVYAEEKCDEKGKCPPGKVCIGGNCIGYLDCPPLIMPVVTPECRVYVDSDEKGCPRVAVVCEEENHKKVSSNETNV
ncbi:hypothetical protein OESDEN_11216 [Oesophagostomum dentatum]|uniref:Uncharacterized protein n=1 Tax=Oesophagostomum dentatum TaxID=61180 RepID=A0A0B1SZN6_OESDE|nr:hypothetical protein OESDEN_11216 [Oesophagostomum dentatum]